MSLASAGLADMLFPMTRFAPAAAVLLLLAGCASSGGTPPRVSRADTGTSAVAASRPAQQRSDLVFGRNAAALLSLFGQPALDVQEGNARKLQFSGQTCVLDAYLYTPQGRGEPVVTHLDARWPDGRDADRASCIAALQNR